MESYNIGDCVSQFIGHPESPLFDVSDAGAEMIIFFAAPTAKEVKQFKAGRSFEIRKARIGNVIFFCVKIGELNWMDVPYTPHLSLRWSDKGDLKAAEGEGLGLTLMLVDSNSGKIMGLRHIGLSTEFTNSFFADCRELMKHPFNQRHYFAEINSVYRRYPTEKILENCDVRYNVS